MTELIITIFLAVLMVGIVITALKNKEVVYYPIVYNFEDGLPAYYIVKETYYFGFSFDYELIGRDRFGLEPFYSVEEMEERINYLKFKLDLL